MCTLPWFPGLHKTITWCAGSSKERSAQSWHSAASWFDDQLMHVQGSKRRSMEEMYNQCKWVHIDNFPVNITRQTLDSRIFRLFPPLSAAWKCRIFVRLTQNAGNALYSILQFNSYSANHDNWCTATLWNRIMTAQCEGMGEVRSVRYLTDLTSPMPEHKGFKLQ